MSTGMCLLLMGDDWVCFLRHTELPHGCGALQSTHKLHYIVDHVIEAVDLVGYSSSWIYVHVDAI